MATLRNGADVILIIDDETNKNEPSLLFEGMKLHFKNRTNELMFKIEET